MKHLQQSQYSRFTSYPNLAIVSKLIINIYTPDFFNSGICFLQKFSDDSAIVGLIANEDNRDYRELTEDAVNWWYRNHPHLKGEKTKELLVDFHKHKHPPPT